MQKRTYNRQMDCCMQHLVKRGYGVLIEGRFVDFGHCTDGRRARCSTCGKSWKHVCDEAEGCSWVCVSQTGEVRHESR